MRNKQGFTMVELLVVLVIVAILAAVATPIYLANVRRSRAAEAVATMSLIRQALRDYQLNTNTYFDIASDDIDLPLPLASTITPATGAISSAAGVDVNVGTARYFSNAAFTVDAAGTGGFAAADVNGVSGLFDGPPLVDFLITATGSASIPCDPADDTLVDCATNQGEASTYVLEMDNSGRVMVSYDGGGAAGTWAAY